MKTESLRPESLTVIDNYLHFRVGDAVTSVPYFNNKTSKSRFTARVFVGKGSAEDIHDELKGVLVKQHIVATSLADEALKKILVDENLGIDCSAFAYHILDRESRIRKQGALNKRLSFLRIKGPVAKMMSYLRPVENTDVITFASDTNSRIIALKEVKPGDIVTMIDTSEDRERNHILIIHQVDSVGDVPQKIFYSHAIQYPEDGLYGSGIRQGLIEISDITKPITDQNWTEDGKTNSANHIYVRARNSRTELRRLKWF